MNCAAFVRYLLVHSSYLHVANCSNCDQFFCAGSLNVSNHKYCDGSICDLHVNVMCFPVQ